MSLRSRRSPSMALNNYRRWGPGTLLLLVGIILGTSGCSADAGDDEASGTAAVVEPAGPGNSQADPAADIDDDLLAVEIDDDPLAVEIDDDVTTTALRSTTTRAPSSPTSSTASSTTTSQTSTSATTSIPPTTTSVTTPSSTTNSQTTPSTTGTTAPIDDGGLGDVIGCQVIESRDVRLEVLNSSQQRQNYRIALELLDGDVVTGDSFASIVSLGPGERTREAVQTLPHTASSCRVTAVEPVVRFVDATELEAASDCMVAGVNTVGVEGLMTVTNRTGSLVDTFVGLGAVYDGEGIRRGTGRILSDSVPDGESRPAHLQTFAQTTSVAGWTCRVIEIEGG